MCANIQMLGWVEKDVYKNEMNKCDVYLHLSLHKPFAIPPLDAMARLAWGFWWYKIYNKYFENGLLYAADSTKDLFKALSFLMENKKSIYRIAKKGIQTAHANYSKQNVVLYLNNVINEIQ